MGRKMSVAPYNVAGHSPSCDRVTGSMRLPAYVYVDDDTCFHCGEVLAWRQCVCSAAARADPKHPANCTLQRRDARPV
jgi:hypothetical protein